MVAQEAVVVELIQQLLVLEHQVKEMTAELVHQVVLLVMVVVAEVLELLVGLQQVQVLELDLQELGVMDYNIAFLEHLLIMQVEDQEVVGRQEV
jgi:hypothetical protein